MRDSLNRYCLGLVARFLLLSLLAPTCSPQNLENPPTPEVPSLYGPRVQAVLIETSVLDKHGDFVAGLPVASFRVCDDGVAQPILFFSKVEEPAKMLVLLETSPAVYLIHDEHLTAAYALVDSLAADDQVGLMTYNHTSQVVLPFTSEKGALLAALGQIQYALGPGDLDLSDSLSSALDRLRPASDKKVIVLITTGLDSSPPDHWDALVKKLHSEDAVIFSVALGGVLRGEPGKHRKKKKNASAPDQSESEAADGGKASAAFAKADEALRSLAKITGGRAYFPQSDKDFVPIYHEIAAALRHEYLLGIAPAHDNQFHQLTVEVLDTPSGPAARGAKSRYRVFARAGYLAPGP